MKSRALSTEEDTLTQIEPSPRCPGAWVALRVGVWTLFISQSGSNRATRCRVPRGRSPTLQSQGATNRTNGILIHSPWRNLKQAVNSQRLTTFFSQEILPAAPSHFHLDVVIPYRALCVVADKLCGQTAGLLSLKRLLYIQPTTDWPARGRSSGSASQARAPRTESNQFCGQGGGLAARHFSFSSQALGMTQHLSLPHILPQSAMTVSVGFPVDRSMSHRQKISYDTSSTLRAARPSGVARAQRGDAGSVRSVEPRIGALMATSTALATAATQFRSVVAASATASPRQGSPRFVGGLRKTFSDSSPATSRRPQRTPHVVTSVAPGYYDPLLDAQAAPRDDYSDVESLSDSEIGSITGGARHFRKRGLLRQPRVAEGSGEGKDDADVATTIEPLADQEPGQDCIWTVADAIAQSLLRPGATPAGSECGDSALDHSDDGEREALRRLQKQKDAQYYQSFVPDVASNSSTDSLDHLDFKRPVQTHVFWNEKSPATMRQGSKSVTFAPSPESTSGKSNTASDADLAAVQGNVKNAALTDSISSSSPQQSIRPRQRRTLKQIVDGDEWQEELAAPYQPNLRPTYEPPFAQSGVKLSTMTRADSRASYESTAGTIHPALCRSPSPNSSIDGRGELVPDRVERRGPSKWVIGKLKNKASKGNGSGGEKRSSVVSEEGTATRITTHQQWMSLKLEWTGERVVHKWASSLCHPRQTPC